MIPDLNIKLDRFTFSSFIYLTVTAMTLTPCDNIFTLSKALCAVVHIRRYGLASRIVCRLTWLSAQSH